MKKSILAAIIILLPFSVTAEEYYLTLKNRSAADIHVCKDYDANQYGGVPSTIYDSSGNVTDKTCDNAGGVYHKVKPASNLTVMRPLRRIAYNMHNGTLKTNQFSDVNGLCRGGVDFCWHDPSQGAHKSINYTELTFRGWWVFPFPVSLVVAEGRNWTDFTPELEWGSLQNIIEGKCLDVPWAKSFEGQELQLWECNGTPAQVWAFTEDNLLKNKLGMCAYAEVDPDSGDPFATEVIKLKECDANDPYSKWMLAEDPYWSKYSNIVLQ